MKTIKRSRTKAIIKFETNNSRYCQNPEYFKQILDIVNSKKKWRNILSLNKDLMNWINETTPLLQNNFYTIDTKLYWIFNDLHNFPCCDFCKKAYIDRNVFTIARGYPEFCSHICVVNSPKTKEKTRQTCIKKYGVSSPGQAESVKKKSQQTCLKKYGTKCSLQSKSSLEKTKQKNLQKYGVEHPSQNKQIQQKIRQTKQQRYGDIQPWHSTDAYAKRKNTWIKKYGTSHPMKSPEIQQKQCESVKSKYNVSYYTQTQSFTRTRLKKVFNQHILNNGYDEPCFSFNEFVQCNHHLQLMSFKCKKCGNIFQSKHINGHHSRCPICYPIIRQAISQDEKNLQQFLSSLGIKYTCNDRTLINPLEIDILIEDKQLAIEYDGLYWHSDAYKDSKYHLMKTELCAKKEIQLIHIFENEWCQHPEIVESRLKNILGIHDTTIFARKCAIKTVDSKESCEFQNQNHLQGESKASVNLGLFFENQLVSLMTFSKSRFSKKYEWEMVRFCNKLNYHIPGAASRLLKYFEKNWKPHSIVSYADRRWSMGNLYNALGFSLDHISPPNYWYFKTNMLYLESRVKYQKHQQKKYLDKFDANKTEVENMKDNGYLRIYDCGNLVFTKVYS